MNLTERIQGIVKSLLDKLAVTEADVSVTEDKGVWKISIVSPDEHALIGRDNEKYEALSHLLKRMLTRDLGEEAKIIIDVNGTRAKNEEALRAKAMMIASRVREFKSDTEMEAMSSYERMLIHGALEGQPNIKTESVGEGRGRRLIIRYVE